MPALRWSLKPSILCLGHRHLTLEERSCVFKQSILGRRVDVLLLFDDAPSISTFSQTLGGKNICYGLLSLQ